MSLKMSTKDDAKRNELVLGLHEDLAREYSAIIQYVIFSQKLDGAENMTIAAQLALHAHEELDHALAIAAQLDYMGAFPTHVPKPTKFPEDNDGMLWADLRAEDETIRNYRVRIAQAEALGEIAMAEIIRGIVRQEQDHQIDLATALGVVPSEHARAGKGPA